MRQRIVQRLLARGVHRSLDVVEPLLRASVGDDRFVERNGFAVGGVHRDRRESFPSVGPGLGHLELLDALEHTLEVRLHVRRVLGLAQDLQ